jgi:hypothetical protein
MGRRAFTPEEKIEAKKRRAIKLIEYRENNREKFDKYMNEYYLQNKKIIDGRRIINRKLRKTRLLEPIV